jgi:hypothetical protein
MIDGMSKKKFSMGTWLMWTLFLYFFGIPVWFLLEEVGFAIIALLIIPVIAAVITVNDRSESGSDSSTRQSPYSRGWSSIKRDQ